MGEGLDRDVARTVELAEPRPEPGLLLAARQLDGGAEMARRLADAPGSRRDLRRAAQPADRGLPQRLVLFADARRQHGRLAVVERHQLCQLVLAIGRG
jgi:hypothetical protein